MEIKVDSCKWCPFRNEGELDTNCNVWHPKAYVPDEPLNKDEYAMEFGLPYEQGEFPNLCPLKLGTVTVELK